MKKNNLLAVLAITTITSHASVLQVANVTLGPGDTLFAGSDNTLLSNSVVAIGTFPVGFDVTGNLGPSSWGNLVDNFTILGSALTGTSSATLGGSFPGYVEAADIAGPTFSIIGNSNAQFVGQTIYGFAGNLTTLADSAATGELGLFQIQTILDDQPFEQEYRADPTGKVVLIGSLGTFTGDAGAGDGVYNTLQLAAIPEPSSLLLSVLGSLALLRRKR